MPLLAFSARQRHRKMRVILPSMCRLPRPADDCHSNKYPLRVSAIDENAGSLRPDAGRVNRRKVSAGGIGGFFREGSGCWVGGHIRCCGNGRLGFRPYGGSLLNSAKVSKTLLPHHLVPRLGSACPHSGQRGLTGRLRSKSKADQEHSGLPAGLSGVKQGQGPERKQSCFSVGAGLPAMASPRSFRNTELMSSQHRYLHIFLNPAKSCSRCRGTRLRWGAQQPLGRSCGPHRSLVPRQRLQKSGSCTIV